MIHSYSVMLYTSEKEYNVTTATYHDVEESFKHNVEQKKLETVCESNT